MALAVLSGATSIDQALAEIAAARGCHLDVIGAGSGKRNLIVTGGALRNRVADGMAGRRPIFKKGAMTAAERMRRYRRRLKLTRPDAKTLAKRARRAQREAALAAATAKASAALGQKLYGVLYVDPPWDFLVRSRATGMDRHAANHYPVMQLAEIAALQLPAAPDCVLFLWATIAHNANALRLIEHWGFEYRSMHIWRKPGVGTGYWVRENAELLLIATRGTVPAPAPGDQLRCLFAARRHAHSEKPEIFAELIERLYPNTPKLEMFARRPRPGWDSWGNEVEAAAE
jgi:N6-adenosine-specific RNA methylase IME4